MRAIQEALDRHFREQRAKLIEEGAPPEVADQAVRLVRQRVERRLEAQTEFIRTEATVGGRQ